jgi:hypothetical protein
MSTSTIEETLDQMQQFTERVMSRFPQTEAAVSA